MIYTLCKRSLWQFLLIVVITIIIVVLNKRLWNKHNRNILELLPTHLSLAFRADCEHHPSFWKQQWPRAAWPGPVRSTKKQPHPLSLRPAASQRESHLRAQGAGGMSSHRDSAHTESSSHLHVQLQHWMLHKQAHFLPTTYFHLFYYCYTLTLSLELCIMTFSEQSGYIIVYKTLEVSFEVQLLFSTAVFKLQWSLRRSFHTRVGGWWGGGASECFQYVVIAHCLPSLSLKSGCLACLAVSTQLHIQMITAHTFTQFGSSHVRVTLEHKVPHVKLLFTPTCTCPIIA